MILNLGIVRVDGLHVAIDGNGCKLSLSLPEKHNYGYYRKDDGPPNRVSLDLRVSVEEAVVWLPLVGKAVDCQLVGISAPQDNIQTKAQEK